MRPTARASGQTLASTAAIVVAAGRGSRLGAGRPKAFVALAGRPMVAWSLDAIAAAGVPRAVVAVPPGHGAAAEEALADAAAAFPLGFALVEGGATRSASVRNALAAAGEVDAVTVHDAARPLATAELFTATLMALEHADAAIAAARVTDTIKEAGEDGMVVRTHDRARLWAIQTPQAFRAAVLRRALDVPDEVLAQATDDAWLVERAGGSVVVVESAPANFKVTTPHDLAVAEQRLS
jgi:2-C-methyl-D-erythritol 4-phosphate cytidylyltransferase